MRTLRCRSVLLLILISTVLTGCGGPPKIPVAAIDAIGGMTQQEKDFFSKGYFEQDWRKQLESLMGMCLQYAEGDAKPAGTAITPINPKIHLGKDNVLLSHLKLEEDSEKVFTFTADHTLSADVASAIGSAGISTKEMELVEVTSTVSISFDKLGSILNDVQEDIRKDLSPNSTALWFVGFTVYRFHHSRFAEQSAGTDLSAGAISANGKYYNKAADDHVTWRIYPRAMAITKKDMALLSNGTPNAPSMREILAHLVESVALVPAAAVVGGPKGRCP